MYFTYILYILLTLHKSQIVNGSSQTILLAYVQYRKEVCQARKTGLHPGISRIHSFPPSKHSVVAHYNGAVALMVADWEFHHPEEMGCKFHRKRVKGY